MAYNKREEGIPVDGLLPSVRLRNNRPSSQLGAVISVCYGKYRRSTQRLSRWGCCTESSLTKLHIPSQSLPFRERGFDRLPFSGMPSEFRYTTSVDACQICGMSKKALDISVQMAYNKREESIPVDGLLPLFELKRFNRHSLQLGAVISFSCHGDCRYYSYDDSKCTRSRLPDSAEIRRVPAGHQTWQTDPSYRSPPICYNDSGSKNQKQAAYRFQVCPQSFSIPHLSRLVKSAECQKSTWHFGANGI